MLDARTTRRSEKRNNKHWRGKESSAAESRPASAWTINYIAAVGPVKRHVHHGRATCDAREPVCLHENTPGELAPLKLIRPGGFVSIWSARSLHFSWNGARLWLALEKSTSEAVS